MAPESLEGRARSPPQPRLRPGGRACGRRGVEMPAGRPGAALRGRPGAPRMPGCRAVGSVQVLAVNLLLSAAAFGARAENDFSMVSRPSRSPTPSHAGCLRLLSPPSYAGC